MEKKRDHPDWLFAVDYTESKPPQLVLKSWDYVAATHKGGGGLKRPSLWANKEKLPNDLPPKEAAELERLLKTKAGRNLAERLAQDGFWLGKITFGR
ncbi:MAG TPA: hypothetical protein VI953_03300 [Candidatus Paceibacterota bacterium]